MPKVLKDIFVHITNSSPSLVCELTVVGFLIMEAKLILLVMDSPTSYVCRVNRLTPLKVPELVEEFGRRMLPIVEVIDKAKLLMEKLYILLVNDETPLDLEFDDGSRNGSIPLCFHIQRNIGLKISIFF
ncbi:hypothetical protein PHYBLDRAFT_145634 [Phycomyces blakesleeanus NRRL 1555(-)]|uniref:Uncharacterized protein n=2 Tax=Phycomyces blakesleeanus TaxID=4837 RepID=A0A163AFZ4_PHYB8|nr:hypothetical protein PHYBLDRAFT_145634 [Phycomyces blakesleeanus NRRL 1555(-)]OAD73231.1 hypothetical protein PHYBLDRAFT_145634 [Phycomyces blakesleeanus NRRL 1555(-)]|eukprot:XP_018291271.1 hypothetical protein PHYBLDRAFT_145634 [Phycomyces blakesleeanus NRRL 1555(-)]